MVGIARKLPLHRGSVNFLLTQGVKRGKDLECSCVITTDMEGIMDQVSQICRECSSDRIVKNGSFEGVQRFLCRDCKRSFTDKKPRFNQSKKDFAIQMYLNNVGIRKIALFLQASPPAVLKWIKKANEVLSEKLKRVEPSEAVDIIEFGRRWCCHHSDHQKSCLTFQVRQLFCCYYWAGGVFMRPPIVLLLLK